MAIMRRLAEHFPEDFLSPDSKISAAAAFLADEILGKLVGTDPPSLITIREQ